jgi:hypothetical protein
MLLREYNRIADVLNTPENRRNRHEFETKRIGQQPRERRFTHPRWAPQNHRVGAPALNRESERSALAKQMVLAKDGGHGPRTHTLGQGLLRLIWE